MVKSNIMNREDFVDKQIILDSLKKYKFYHIIDLGNGILTPGEPRHLPIQRNVHTVLQSIPIKGKRVLDIGCRDGLFCFEAEKLGAKEVIGIDNDLSPAAIEFLIPYFNSRVKMFNLNLFDLNPDTYGKFDVIIFAGVLYHLRYPFWALNILKELLAEDGYLIIETAVLDKSRYPLLYCPVGKESPFEPTSVTFFNVKGLVDTLTTLGIHTTRTLFYKRQTIKRILLHLLRFLPLPLIRAFIKDPIKKAKIRRVLPTKRTTLVCRLSQAGMNRSLKKYWEAGHGAHTEMKL